MAKFLLFDPLGSTRPQCLYLLMLTGMLLSLHSWVPNPEAASLPLLKTLGYLKPYACPQRSPTGTVKHIYSEPILLSHIITIVCNSLFLPMHLFPFISFISGLLLWLQQTREHYKDDIMPKSQG